MRRVLLFAAALLFPASASLAAEPTFRALERFSETPGIEWPVACSSDGSVLLGHSSFTPWTWTSATGYTPITVPSPPDAFIYFANDLSPDGKTTFGALSVDMQGGAYFRLTAGEDVEYPLGTPTFPFSGSGIEAAADNETFALSLFSEDGRQAARWNPSGGYELIGDLPGGAFDSRPTDISDDGRVVVGIGTDDQGPVGFRWTVEDGLIPLSGGGIEDSATLVNAVSADGNVVVGQAAGSYPVRWTLGEGIEPLIVTGESPTTGIAWATSKAGERIVGGSQENGAFIWTERSGILSLYDLLADRYELQESLNGWHLSGALVISADGTTIYGIGTDPQGKESAWAATVPEPSSAVLFVVNCALLVAATGLRKN